MFRFLLFLPALVFSFQVEHPLFVDLLKHCELTCNSENQHHFFSLQESLYAKIQEISKTKMHEVYEIIHVPDQTFFPPTMGAITTVLYVDSISKDLEGVLVSKLSCKSMPDDMCGRTYLFSTVRGLIYALNFQEEKFGACKKITFGPVDSNLVFKKIETTLDYLLLHDQNYLAMPLKKRILANIK